MNRIAVLAILVFLFTSCMERPLNDTEFAIRYKTIDGTWEGPLYYDFPRSTKFFIEEGGTGGTYSLMYKNDFTQRGLLKKAVIDFRVIGTTLIIDTTAKKIDLVNTDTLR